MLGKALHLIFFPTHVRSTMLFNNHNICSHDKFQRGSREILHPFLGFPLERNRREKCLPALKLSTPALIFIFIKNTVKLYQFQKDPFCLNISYDILFYFICIYIAPAQGETTLGESFF